MPMPLRDIVRDYVIEHLADDDAVLVIDETGLSQNRAKASCGRVGAAIHWFGRGRLRNCQIGRLRYLRVRATVMRSSTVRCIFRRNGPTIRIAWKPHMCPPDCRFCDQTKALRRE